MLMASLEGSSMNTLEQRLAIALLITLAGGAEAGEPAAASTGQVIVDVHDLPPPPAREEIATTERAQKTFATRCASCHGATGRGDGPAARALNPRPRDFSSAQWQTAVDDTLIASAIRFGGTAVKKSPTMPPHPDLDGEHLNEVIALLRSFKKAGPATVFLRLERANAKGAPDALGAKRLRLKGDAIRARFKDVAPGEVKVSGFVDLDGDAARSDGEPAFETPLLAVSAGGEAKHAVRLKSEARPPQGPRAASERETE
jgi:mono/diheme cytochrome c family protein